MDKAFTVSLCNPDKEVYVALDLPAEPYALLDVWERLRPAPGTQVEWEIEDYGEFHILFPSLQSGENLPALNLLAEQLSGSCRSPTSGGLGAQRIFRWMSG